MKDKTRKAIPLRGRKDIIDQLNALLPKLHPAESQLARLMLREPDWVVSCSIKELAEKAGVSEPTVMRLCRKLNMDGYAAFKLRLVQDLVLARMYLAADNVIERETPTTIAAHMQEAVLKGIDEAARSIVSRLLSEAAAAIVAAKRVFCLGVGGSSAILADEAENRLFRLGIAVQSSADPYRQYMAAAIAGEGDFFLCMSATGKPAPVVESAKLARENGAIVCSIAPSDSDLAAVSTIVLRLDVTDSERYFNLPSATRYAQLFILDCLSAEVAKQIGKPSAENLKSIRTVLSALHGPSLNQPVGD
jgi:RpiR family carbohydrate utilization transcriptional regulator